MKLPDNLKIKVSRDLFEKYLFNSNHMLGKYRAEYFVQVELSISTLDSLVDELMRIPKEQDYVNIKVLYKLGFIYRIEFITGIAVENKKFFLHTIWLHREKTKDVELINLNVI